MTRKHFEALAAALAESRPEPTEFFNPQLGASADHNQYREALAQWRADVRAIAAVCLAHNPRFDDSRFHAACGYWLHYGEIVG